MSIVDKTDVGIAKVAFVYKTLTCADCGQDFIFTEGEQRYFWSKGLAEPKRCKPCRVVRRKSLISIMKEEDHNDHRNKKSSQPGTSTTL